MSDVRITRLMRLEAWVAQALLNLFLRMGPARASNFAGGFCRFIGPLLPVSKIADKNLQLAMPELNAPERARIIRGVWENLGRTVGELPHLSCLQENTPSGPGFEVQGAEYLEEQARHGGAVLFVSGHIGNWEMLPPGVAGLGRPFAAFYRGAGNPLIDPFCRFLG